MTGPHETESSLADIDRKLRALQEELARIFEPPRAPPAGETPPAALTPPAPMPAPPPRPRASPAEALLDHAVSCVSGLDHHIAGLLRKRDELSHALEDLRHHLDESEAIGPSPRLDAEQMQGPVLVDVGPFMDMGSLSAFEHALTRLPDLGEMFVRSFEGNRALIDLRLDSPLELAEELRRVVPFPLSVVDAGPGRLSIDIDSSRPGATARRR